MTYRIVYIKYKIDRKIDRNLNRISKRFFEFSENTTLPLMLVTALPNDLKFNIFRFN